MSQLWTTWGETLNKKAPLQEYPRPQLVRNSYINLNGEWHYCVHKEGATESIRDGKIVVPFSPEAPLSGCDFWLQKDEVLEYDRTFKVPKDFINDHVILHFGAVDQECTVYVNDQEVCRHIGGYLPFSCDITHALNGKIIQYLRVVVRDKTEEGLTSYGKQKFDRGGIWYTPQSGIWQTVWLEAVCNNYIQSIRITPDVIHKNCKIQIKADDPTGAVVRVKNGEETVTEITTNAAGSAEVHFYRDNLHLWTPEDPFLYQIEIVLGKDSVSSYFGMRNFGQTKINGIPVPTINGKPYFETGLLDQGYWPDGLYTAPSDEALQFDIRTAKEMGFNMLRKHIKIEPLRWYYYCDVMGMLVWQDMPSGGNPFNPMYTQILPFMGIHLNDTPDKRFGRENQEARKQFEKELDEMIDLLYNCVSLCTWVPFNEGWGQFDAENIAAKVRIKDPTRLVDHASGWHDRHAGNYKSRHVYYRPVVLTKSKDRILALTEFGGYSLPVKEHVFSEAHFGYKGFHSQKRLEKALKRLYCSQILPAKNKKGLCVTIYTQISDVEDELNGLMTYDRKIIKVDVEKIRTINERMKSMNG